MPAAVDTVERWAGSGEPPVDGGPARTGPTGEVGESRLRQVAEVAGAHKSATLGLLVVVALVLFCWIGPLVYRTNQVATALQLANRPPSVRFPLGTDNVGYSILGRLMAGGQTSLEVGLGAAAFALMLGVFWGSVSGYVGGLVDSVMMRIVDATLAIPIIFLLLFIASMVTPSVPLLIFIIGLVSWPTPARLIRAETLSLRHREYVDAARTAGGGHTRVIFRHILPNALGTIIVNGTFQVSDAIIALASLSFLGLGIPPPATNWGEMLSNGVNYVFEGYWWQVLPAGLAIVVIVVAFNLVGDGLRDVFEVRLRRR